MKKATILILALTIILASLLTACTENKAEGEGSGETITITDHNGDTVTLPADIDRIAVCDIFPMPSVLSIFFDSAEKIVSMAPTSMSAAENGLLSDLYPEILDADTSAMSGVDVNVEELMKLNPQVVFYSSTSAQLGETLRKAGFNAVGISADKWDYNCVETLNQWIDLLSRIFPDSANNRKELVKKFSEESLNLVKSRTDKLSEEEKEKVFFLFQYSNDSIVSSAQTSFGQWWADAIGAINAAEELEGENSVKVTLEQVYSWNPDIILMTNFTTATPDDIYNNTIGSYNWSGISAVQNKRVYKMPLGMYRSYTLGIDTPITLLWLAKTVYPDLFSDVDITEKTIEYYKTVFDISLTAEQAESIFAPQKSAGKTDF